VINDEKHVFHLSTLVFAAANEHNMLDEKSIDLLVKTKTKMTGQFRS
jgi:hypothetical protein